MEGVLLVRKPAGWTSFDVVARVRRIVAESVAQRPKSVKVGHSGTLDPFATGLLVLCIGKSYTRRISEFTGQDKTYEVVMWLGTTSSSGDPEGTLSLSSDYVPTRTELERVLRLFVGTIQQVPPAFSAIKVNGQRAYKLARAGKDVSLPVRMVTVSRLNCSKYDYPSVAFTVDVSSGTYVRSLVEDIGKALKTGAYTAELSRTRIGTFTLDEAVDVASLNSENILRQLRVV